MEDRVPPTVGALISDASRERLFYPLLDVFLYIDAGGSARARSAGVVLAFSVLLFNIHLLAAKHTGVRRRVFRYRLTGALSDGSLPFRGSSCFLRCLGTRQALIDRSKLLFFSSTCGEGFLGLHSVACASHEAMAPVYRFFNLS